MIWPSLQMSHGMKHYPRSCLSLQTSLPSVTSICPVLAAQQISSLAFKCRDSHSPPDFIASFIKLYCPDKRLSNSLGCQPPCRAIRRYSGISKQRCLKLHRALGRYPRCKRMTLSDRNAMSQSDFVGSVGVPQFAFLIVTAALGHLNTSLLPESDLDFSWLCVVEDFHTLSLTLLLIQR